MRYEFLSNLDLLGIKVLSVGYSNDTEITYAKCSRNQFIIHYVTDGIGYFNDHKIEANQAFIIPPNKYANYYPDKENPWTFFWIILTPNAYELTKKVYKNIINNIFTYSFRELIVSLGERITQNTMIGYNDSDCWEVYSNILCAQIKDYQKEKNIFHTTYAQYAKRFFDVNYYRQVKVEEVCKNLNISQPYLYKEFKKKYGLSMKQYIEKVKYEHAKELLLSTDMNITQVAESVGFDDVLAFSAFFKKHSNYSPLNYRKNIMKEKQM